MVKTKAPGKAHRQGISLLELAEMFPDEESAVRWFESTRWPDGPRCPHCDNSEVAIVKSRKPMPFRCNPCARYFSVRTGTVMERSKISLRKWSFAVYLCATSLKSVSSMKLHRDLKITQKSAWFMAHRIREALSDDGGLFSGPVEVDETYFGGRDRNRPLGQRSGKRGPSGKAPVIGAKDRKTGKVKARAITSPDGPTLQGFVNETVEPDSVVYTDEHRGYIGLDKRRRGQFFHGAVRHSAGEYVRGMAHTNGIESFWSMLKRSYHGTFHHFSAKHMQRYINEFAARQGLRESDTVDLMGAGGRPDDREAVDVQEADRRGTSVSPPPPKPVIIPPTKLSPEELARRLVMQKKALGVIYWVARSTIDYWEYRDSLQTA